MKNTTTYKESDSTKKVLKILIILFIATLFIIGIFIILNSNLEKINTAQEAEHEDIYDVDIVYWGDSLTYGAGGKRNKLS